ncbi:type VI secretion system-associated protein VasI [Providencia sp. PROV257]|uniref:type VI secretion system-associated protein VasI n=1 Tax=Providencia sp. PROV257 TaxID=2949945 RepID=UPI00234B66AD|nr:type VI secretion system-associated protein VasI [Providencia sp. PROV257]HEM7133671.1 type VI secretion system-associated protein TagO [Providencia rettgeri]
MKILKLFFCSLMLVFFALSGKAESNISQKIAEELTQCRLESSQLIRLDCYDKIALSSTPAANTSPNIAQMGKTWRQAYEHEMKRVENSAGFLVSVPENGDYPVIMTIPAIGFQPPRPVLMLSCIDNITRMQIILPNKQDAGSVIVSTDRTQFTAEWFLRENGYVLESSRGLPGIDEIKRLLNGEKLTLKLTNNEKLTFNISGMSQEIKPLRAACHW